MVQSNHSWSSARERLTEEGDGTRIGYSEVKAIDLQRQGAIYKQKISASNSGLDPFRHTWGYNGNTIENHSCVNLDGE